MKPPIKTIILFLSAVPALGLAQPRSDAGARAPHVDAATPAAPADGGAASVAMVSSSAGRPLTPAQFRQCFAEPYAPASLPSPLPTGRHTYPSMAEACAHLRQRPASAVYVSNPVGNFVIADTAAGATTTPSPNLEATVLIGVADFFVSRARAEAQLFIQERLGDAVCPPASANPDGGTALVTAQQILLSNTCHTFRLDNGDLADPSQLISLPTAFRQDFDALPVTLPTFLIKEIPNTFPAADRQAVHLTMCVATMFGVAAPHFGHGPPELAFTSLADLLSPSVVTPPPAAPTPLTGDALLLHTACDPALTADQQHAVADALRGIGSAVGSLASDAQGGSLSSVDGLRAQYVAATQLDALSRAPAPAAVSAAPDAAAATSASTDATPAPPALEVTLAWLDAHRAELTRLGAAIAELRRQGSNNERAAELLDAAAAVLGAITEHPAVVAALPTDPGLRAAVQHDVPAIVDAAADLLKKQYLTGALALLHLQTVDLLLSHMASGPWKTLLVNLRSFGSLIGTIAQARTSDDVAAALEAAAAPVGSYRQIRRPGITVSIAGQFGLFGGAETALQSTGVDGSGAERLRTHGAFGATLPIGLEVGGGIGHGWSFQALFSVLDLGTLATAAIGGSSTSPTGTTGASGTATATTPDVGSVLAPGVFVGFGIPHTPLVFGPMIEFAPLMRRYLICTTSACDTTGLPTLRYGLVLNVDLPVLRLF